MKKALFAACICMLMVGCFSVNVGTQKIDVYEQYPIYTVEQKPVIQNLTGNEMDPHLRAAEVAAEIMSDGKITPEEKTLYDRAMETAENVRIATQAKHLANYNALILWGKKNQATVETYNEYAREKNERLKVAAKAK
jgi:hypothetical protein